MRKNRLKGIIALMIMIIAMIGMYLYLTLGQEAFTTKSVVVATNDINKGTVIGYEHFTEKRVREDDLLAGGLDDSQISSVIGLASTQFIPANSQVLSRYFADPGIVVTGENFVYKIPSDWIYAVPSSIRRTDELLIYEIDSRIDQGIDQSIRPAKPEDVPEITTNNIAAPVDVVTVDVVTGEGLENSTESKSEPIISNPILPTYEEDFVAEPVIADKEPILQTTVIYVKDSANREVVDIDGGKRLDASSQVSSIEIVCTKDDITKIEEKIAEGKKLVLVYR